MADISDSRNASWGLYSQPWSKERKPNPKLIANFTEMELAELIRQYTDAHLKGIYRFRRYFVGEQEKSIHWNTISRWLALDILTILLCFCKGSLFIICHLK